MQNQKNQQYKAVLFDVGGVLTSSPFATLATLEKKLNLQKGFFALVISKSGKNGAWQKLERNEINLEQFSQEFHQECKREGGNVDGKLFLQTILEGTSNIDAKMLEAILTLRKHHFIVAAVTNNWFGEKDEKIGSNAFSKEDLFDKIFESRVLGINKPDPRIFQFVCNQLQVKYHQTIFLDDIGQNCKSASKLGITCIKVNDTNSALMELQKLVGIILLPEPSSKL